MEKKKPRQLLLALGLVWIGIMLLSFTKQTEEATTGKGKKLSFQVVILNTKVLKDLLSSGADTILFQQINLKDDATGFLFKKRNRYELIAYVHYKNGTVKKNRDVFYTYNHPLIKITKTFKTIVNDNTKGMDAGFGNIPLNLNDTCLKLRQINPDADDNSKFLVLHPRAGKNKGNIDLSGYVVYDVYFASGKKDIDPNDSPEGKIDYKALLTLNPSPPA